MSAPTERGNTRIQTERAENCFENWTKSEPNGLRISSIELTELDHCAGRGCADLP